MRRRKDIPERYLYPPSAASGNVWTGFGRARSGRTCHHVGNGELLFNNGLYTQFARWIEAIGLSDDMGRWVPGLSEKTGCPQTGDRLRWFECSSPGNRFEEPEDEPNECRFYRSGKGKVPDLLDAGFVDTFRHFYPDREGIYSWWSYRFKAREKNAGWRIDYFLVSERLKPQLTGAEIHTEIFGSDHCR